MILEALEALRNGEIILVTDDENRENEGDFICAGEFATPENINFMAIHGKGLICMPITSQIATRLKFPQMSTTNTDNHETAFTVSIDHIDTTTGISAIERSLTTIKVGDESSRPEDFRRPGHMFPLVAKEHGVLERNGHTEATVDLMRLAGLKPYGLCCEIMDENGDMMRMSKLKEKAKEWNVKFTTIKELQEYRKKHDRLIELQASPTIPTEYGIFRAYGYKNILNNDHHVAFVKGDIADGKNILCRVHSECLTGDTFGSKKCDCGKQLEFAMRAIEKEGRGILLYLRQEGRGIGLLNKLKAYELQYQGMDTLEANIALGFDADLREYYIGCQILKDLGVQSVYLMTNNPDKLEKVLEYGIEIIDRIDIQIEANEFDRDYQKTKKEKMGHFLTDL